MRKCSKIEILALLVLLCLGLSSAGAMSESTPEIVPQISPEWTNVGTPYILERLIISDEWTEQTDGVIQDHEWVSGFFIDNYAELREAYGGDYHWSIELISGADLGAIINVIYEWEGQAGMYITVMPTIPGDSVYCVTCQWGSESNSMDVIVRAVELENKPTGTNVQSCYTMKVGETLKIDGDFVPAGWSMPHEYARDFTWFYCEAFGVSLDVSGHRTTKYIYAKEPGIYTVNYWLRCNGTIGAGQFILYVTDENGNVPNPEQMELGYEKTFDEFVLLDSIWDGEFGVNDLHTEDRIASVWIEESFYTENESSVNAQPVWQVDMTQGEDFDWYYQNEGNQISLWIRHMPAQETDAVFTVTCLWGNYIGSKEIAVRFVEYELPTDFVTDDVIELTVGQRKQVNYTIYPEGWTYTNQRHFDAWTFTKDGVNIEDWSVFSCQYENGKLYLTANEHVQPGTYTGCICLRDGSINYVMKPITFIIKEAPLFRLDDASAYDWSDRWAAFEDNAEIGLIHRHGIRNYCILNFDQMKQSKQGNPVWNAELIGDSHGAKLNTWVWDDKSGFDVNLENQPTEACTLRYKVTCTWDGETIEAYGTLDFITAELPTGAVIPDTVEMTINETTSIPMHFIPEDFHFGWDYVSIYIEGLNQDKWAEGHTQYITPYEAGIFYGYLGIFSNNIEIGKSVIFRVADENGVVPAVVPDIDEEMYLEYYLMPDDTKGYNLELASDAYDIEIRNLNMLRTQYGEDDFQVSFNQISGPSLNISSTNELRWENCLALILPGVENMREESDAVVDATVTYAGHSATTRLNFHFRKVVLPEIQFENDFTLQVGETYEATVSIQPADWADTYFLYYDFNDESNFEKWGDGDNQQTSFWFKPREAGWYSSGPHIHARNMFIRGDWFDFAVKDENGNVPELKLAFTDSGAYNWTTDMVAFADDASIGLGHGTWARNYQIANYDILTSMKTGEPKWNVEWEGDDHGARVSYGIGTWAGSGSRAIDVWINDQPATPCTLHYKVTCTWDGETIVGNGTVNFSSADLPTGAVIPDVVELKINETTVILTSFIPESYSFQGNEGTYLYINGLNWNGWVDRHMQYITPYEAGTFYGRLYVQSRNVEISKTVIFRIADENGNVPGEIIPIDEAHFPDAVFRAYLQENFGWKQEDNIFYTAPASVEEINLTNAGVSSVQGIEYFPNLRRLYIYQNQLTNLNVSGCSALEYLYCYNNQLTSLNIGDQSNLYLLSCFSNQLTSLDVSDCPALQYLYCYDNQLSSLDVSGNPKLQRLWCGRNQLKSLDVSANPALQDLNCEGMNVTVTGLVNPDAYISSDYVLIQKPVEELMNAGVTVYLDMNCWDMTGALDANGVPAPRLVPITDDTYYRDLYVSEDDSEAWVSAKYLYEHYFAPGTRYESYADSYLYVLASSVNKHVLTLPASMTVIEAEAFAGIAAETVVIPNGCTSIGSRAFADCGSLVEIVIPASVTSIAEDAFEGCANFVINTPGAYVQQYADQHHILWINE